MRLNQSHLASLATTISTSSAMNPVLVMCLIICPFALAAAGGLYWAKHTIPATLFFVLGCTPVAVGLWQLIIFTINDPDRLQREQHIERMTQIRGQITVRQGEEINAVPVSDYLTSNSLAGSENA
jgi:hypothetical protein